MVTPSAGFVWEGALLPAKHQPLSADNDCAAPARFRKALRTHPNAPAEVRLGIGAAAFKLGRHDTARSAFQRALHLQPRCVPALAGLAVLAMHAPPSANVS